jgi:23S rRNA (uracil1939-C5)-methyltransferase
MTLSSRELTITGPATGGEGVGRDDDGRATFVSGALPGERVIVELTDEHDRWARGSLREVVEPSADRVTPPCPEVSNGCGGCDLQHASLELQRSMKVDVVRDAIVRLGKISDPPDIAITALSGAEYRSAIRLSTVGGRGAYRKAKSHDLIAVDWCMVAHPLVQEILVEGRFPSAKEVAIRVGVRTGERMVVVEPTAADVSVPDDVIVVGINQLKKGRKAHIHEEVAGSTFRISAGSFFQSRPDGADALVRLVAEAAGDHAVDRMVDLFAGVGLFAATVDADQVEAVEGNRTAARDARHNLDGIAAKVHGFDVADWRPSQADFVVADPPRDGLGAAGVDKVAATGAPVVALVSCDAASLGRDAGLMRDAGYTLNEVDVVDMFPQTHHVEVVSVFSL